MYKLYPQNPQSSQSPQSVERLSDGASVPIHDYANTDYQQFKKDIQNGVVLNDAEGNPITGEALTTFIASLP